MAKHDALRKLKRNWSLVDYRDRHPDLTWEEVAEQFGVSRQRAQAIYASMMKREKAIRGT